MEPTMGLRRSGRIVKHIPVTLRWQSPGCNREDHAAETTLLSRYGCMVVCGSRVKIGSEVCVLCAELGKSTRARVVYRELTGSSARVTLALEFIDNDDFWQIEFPPNIGSFGVS